MPVTPRKRKEKFGPITLRERANKNGTVSLRLDIHHNGKRWVETLKHLTLKKSSNPADREANKDILKLAKEIAIKKASDLASGEYNITSKSGRKTKVIDWMQGYVDKYKMKDKRNMQGALNRFNDFLAEDGIRDLTFGNLSEEIITDFQDYLRLHCVGEGASSYFSRFKKMMKRAYSTIMKGFANPALNVRNKKAEARRKDILTLDEIRLISKTHTESPQVKSAFLFSCMTGLRWCDVKSLVWRDIDLKKNEVTKEQSKVEGESKTVTIPLNETAIKLLGDQGKPGDLVFKLPSANGANKTIKAIIKRAKIEKKISWHNARHSFGTNVIASGSDVTTASRLLGHSTLKHTQRYVNTAKELKEKAVNNLNI